MTRKKRRTWLAVIGMLLPVFGAFFAGSALATHSGHVWEVNGSNLANGGSESMGCEKETGSTFTFTSKILGGTNLKVTAGKMECIEGKITQDIVSEKATATGSGKLKFSELAVDEPAGCKVKSPIETVNLQNELVTNAGVTSGLVNTSKPASGTTIMNIVLEACAAAETYPVKGSYCSEVRPIGSVKIKIATVFLATLHTNCPGDIPLIGINTFLITGLDLFFPVGPNLGKPWWATAY